MESIFRRAPVSDKEGTTCITGVDTNATPSAYESAASAITIAVISVVRTAI
ncbi:MAG: hypothetical protein HY295_00250 [Thaumarchaeota archaeon]|nr:hypothetical protein [Nitrososphaerota archaeon]